MLDSFATTFLPEACLRHRSKKFSSGRTIVNLAIRENGPVTSNVFSGTFIPDDGAKQRRAPIPSGTIERVQLGCQKLDDGNR